MNNIYLIELLLALSGRYFSQSLTSKYPTNGSSIIGSSTYVYTLELEKNLHFKNALNLVKESLSTDPTISDFSLISSFRANI